MTPEDSIAGYWSVEDGRPYWVDDETHAHLSPLTLEVRHPAWAALAEMITHRTLPAQAICYGCGHAVDGLHTVLTGDGGTEHWHDSCFEAVQSGEMRRSDVVRFDAARSALQRLATLGHEPWKTAGHPMNEWVRRDTVNRIAQLALCELEEGGDRCTRGQDEMERNELAAVPSLPVPDPPGGRVWNDSRITVDAPAHRVPDPPDGVREIAARALHDLENKFYIAAKTWPAWDGDYGDHYDEYVDQVRDKHRKAAQAALDALAAAGAVVVFGEGLPMGARLHVHRVDEDGLMWLWTNPRRVLTDKEPQTGDSTTEEPV